MLIVLQIASVLLLIMFVLLQKSGGDGMANLTSGNSNNFGADNFLYKMTVIVAIVFMLNSLMIARSAYVSAAKVKSVVEATHESQRIKLNLDRDKVEEEK